MDALAVIFLLAFGYWITVITAATVGVLLWMIVWMLVNMPKKVEKK